MSLTQLVGHCMIYAGDRGSNPGHPTYPSLWVEFLAIKLLDKKNKLRSGPGWQNFLHTCITFFSFA
jgi:hypothetical protein